MTLGFTERFSVGLVRSAAVAAVVRLVEREIHGGKARWQRKERRGVGKGDSESGKRAGVERRPGRERVSSVDGCVQGES